MRYLEAAADIKNLLEIVPVKCSDDEKNRVLTFVGELLPDEMGYVEENDPADPNGNYMEPPMDDEGGEIGCTHNDLRLVGGSWDTDTYDQPRYIGGRVQTEGERGLLVQWEGSPWRNTVDYSNVGSSNTEILPRAYPLFPRVDLMAQSYTANVGFGAMEDPDIANPRVPSPSQLRGQDWITVSRVGGEEINTMDGFTGISQQVIRVTSLSLSRTNASYLANYVHERINNIVGKFPLQGEFLDVSHDNLNADGEPDVSTPRTMTLDFQCCLLDEEFDQNDAESSVFGKDQFYLVVVSP